jgi:hypothetical protein
MGKKRKDKGTPAQYSDVGTPELHKRKEIILTGQGETRRIARVKYTSNLHIHMSYGRITDNQYEAGYKLAKLWQASGRMPFVTARLDTQNTRVRKGDAEEHGANSRLDSAQYFDDSLRAVRAGCRNLVFAICCLDETVEENRHLYGAKAMDILRAGLDDLVRFYRHNQRY